MNKFRMFIITSLYLLCLNIVFIILIYHHLALTNTIFYALISIPTSAIINLLSELFKEKAKKIFLIVVFSLITLIHAAQFVHYHFYECFFSFYSLFHGGQVAGFIPAILKVIANNLFGFIILIALLVLIVYAIVKTTDDKTNYKKIKLGIICIIFLIISIISIIIPSKNIYSRKNLLFNTNLETQDVQSFGLNTAMMIDLKRFAFGQNYELSSNINKSNYDKDKYNVLDIDFDNIKSNNKEVNRLTKYLKNRKPTSKNKYTGIFKDKNLIFITAESFSFSLIDKDITPNLYKISNEGFSFTNFYTPIYYASTSDGEFTNLTGLYPMEGVWSYIDTLNKSFPYAYGNILKENGYDTFAYHNGIYDFYDRNTVMPNLGYTYEGCGNGLEKDINCNLWPQSDDEMISETFKDYKDSKKFHTYYMSISGHLSHNFRSNDMALKYKDKVKNLKYSTATRAYISANIDLDVAIGHLLDNLEKESLLEDTVIVLVPDHFPYGLSNKEYKDLRELNTFYDKHKSGLIIYNASEKGTSSDKYASNVDILPTLLNMFGIDYDSKLIAGEDIMSDSDGIVIFNDRSFMTDMGYYNERNNKFTNFTDNYSSDYIEKQRELVQNKVNLSNMILKNNYYKYIKSYSNE